MSTTAASNPGWFAVFGQPIAHSRSPAIHQAFAAQAGITLRYERIEAGLEQFDARLAQAREQGLAGANLTLPLKLRGYQLCHQLSPRARAARAVNTLQRTAAGWAGDNTDGAGLLTDLVRRHGLALHGRRVLLLGAGGAAQGVLPALLAAQPAEVVVANRTLERAQDLARQHGINAAALPALARLGRFDLVLNAAAAGHQQQRLKLPDSLFERHAAAYDLSYGSAAHPFLDWAGQAGASRLLDGLGMLVEQAALAFETWHGLLPQTEPVYAALRAEIG